MSKLNERFSSALHSTARAWRLAVDRRLKHLGLSQATWLAITIAPKATEPLSQTDLAHRLGIEGATMVATVDRLVKAGLVVREPLETDRRVKHVVLTEVGNSLYNSVRAEADIFRNTLLANVDKEKLQIVTELLEQLQAVAESSS